MNTKLIKVLEAGIDRFRLHSGEGRVVLGDVLEKMLEEAEKEETLSFDEIRKINGPWQPPKDCTQEVIAKTIKAMSDRLKSEVLEPLDLGHLGCDCAVCKARKALKEIIGE